MENEKTFKCSNCQSPNTRPGYCSRCLETYRKVLSWLKQDHIIRHNTPAGFVFTLNEPTEAVKKWLLSKNKLPDLEALRNEAAIRTIRSITPPAK